MRKLFAALLFAVLAMTGLAAPASAQGPQDPDPNTAYLIANYGLGGRCVDLPGFGPGRVDGPVNQWRCNSPGDNQKFYFDLRGMNGRGQKLYWIRNATDGLCLDLPGSSAPAPATKIAENVCTDNDNQYWLLEAQFSRHQSEWYYWIREAKTSMCLDVPGVADAPLDVQLEVYPCRADDDHEWTLLRTSS
jgi:hypothetical protein